MMGLVPLKRRDARELDLSSLSREDTARRGSSPEPNHAGTLTLDFQPQEL